MLASVKHVVAVSLIAAAIAFPALAWPDRPIRLVVGFQAGGSADSIGRLLGERLRPQLGGTAIIIENKPGAAGSIAADAVLGQEVAGQPRLVDRAGDRLVALVPGAQMLGRAVIGLQPGKAEVPRVADAAREIERRLARLDTAAVAAHVDLDMHREIDPGLAGGGFQIGDLQGIVDADADPRRSRTWRAPGTRPRLAQARRPRRRPLRERR